MRLLNSREITQKKKVSHDFDLYKAWKSKKILATEVEKLKEFKDSIEPKKRQEVEAFSVYMLEMQGKKGQILKEIKEAEEARDKVMLPLYERKMELMELEEELNNKKSNLIEKENILAKQKEELQEELSQKRALINDKIHKLTRIEKEIGEKQEEISQRDENLKKKEAEYNARASKLTCNEEKQETDRIYLENREQALNGKFEAIKQKEDWVNKQLKIIESRQAQLKTAYQEIKKR